MARTAAISIRVEADLKRALEKLAQDDRRSLASYAERILEVHSSMPKWKLKDPQPHYSSGKGPQVALPIADGWPIALLSPDRAEQLGKDLVEQARISRKLRPDG